MLGWALPLADQAWRVGDTFAGASPIELEDLGSLRPPIRQVSNCRRTSDCRTNLHVMSREFALGRNRLFCRTFHFVAAMLRPVRRVTTAESGDVFAVNLQDGVGLAGPDPRAVHVWWFQTMRTRSG